MGTVDVFVIDRVTAWVQATCPCSERSSSATLCCVYTRSEHQHSGDGKASSITSWQLAVAAWQIARHGGWWRWRARMPGSESLRAL